MYKFFLIPLLALVLFIAIPHSQPAEAPTIATSTPTQIASSSANTASSTKTVSKKPIATTPTPEPKKKAATLENEITAPTKPSSPTPTPEPKEEPHTPNTNSAPVITAATLELKIHELINKERIAQGLSPLAWEPALLPAARAHSSDMAKRGYFAHESPEGESFSERYTKAGFKCEVRVANTIYLGAENIFQNNLYDSWSEINGVRTYDWNSLEEIAATTVSGWMKSPGHRTNILTPFWLREAIGVAFSANDEILITQNFC